MSIVSERTPSESLSSKSTDDLLSTESDGSLIESTSTSEENIDDNDEELSSSWDSNEGEEDTTSHSTHLTRQEMIRFCSLKKHIGKMKGEIEKKKKEIQNLREQLTRSRQHYSILLGEKKYLEGEMVGSGSVILGRSIMGMLHGQATKVIGQIHEEEQTQMDIQTALAKVEAECLEAQVMVNQYDKLKSEISQGEAEWKLLKERELSHRLEVETRLVTNAKISKSLRERKVDELNKQKVAAKAAMQELKRICKEKKSLIQEKLIEHRTEKAKAEKEQRKHLEQRMKAILSLKDNIDSSQGTMKAQQLLKQEKQHRQFVKDEEERKKILEENGNPEEVFLRRKRMQQFKEKLAEYKKRQRDRKLDIVARLLSEENSIRKRKKQNLAKKKEKKQKIQQAQVAEPLTTSSKDKDAVEEVDSSRIGAQLSSEIHSDLYNDGTVVEPHPLMDCNIIEPEIRGLWDKTSVIDKVSLPSKSDESMLEREWSTKLLGEDFKWENRKSSKTEQMMMKEAMGKLRKSIIIKQVAGGKEFKGQAFSSNPQVVIFKDFDVGKVYKRKVKLTNISYTVNYCRLEGISSNIKDFVRVTFDHPGPMSAGMTCKMQVTFQPQLEEDIEGDIQMLSQTGPFSIPVKCQTKKCQVSVDRTQIDFGEVYLGETARQKLNMFNTGALGTEYMIACYTISLPRDDEVTRPAQKEIKDLTSLSQEVGSKDATNEEEEEKRWDSVSVGPLGDRSTDIMSEVVTPSSRPIDYRGLGVIASGSTTYPLKSKSAILLSAEEQAKRDKTASPVGTSNTKNREESSRSPLPKSQSTPNRSRLRSRADKTSEPKSDHQNTQEDTTQPVDQDNKSEPIESQGASQIEGSGRDGTELQDDESSRGGKEVEGTAPDSQVIERSAIKNETGEKLASLVPAIQVKENLSYGEILPFTTCPIEFNFSPETVGECCVRFQITFTHSSAPPLEISASGSGIDLPVYLEQETVDLRICMFDRLYQTSIIVHNRASTALEVTFQVPSDLHHYLEVLPKHGVIQGKVSFAAQLKFRPLPSLPEHPIVKSKYFVKSDGRWKMPVYVLVGGQVRSLNLSVFAEVVSSDFTFSPILLEFGSCTTHESVTSSLTITNTSTLPQSFGFIDIPDFIEIQPNDGFGQILPRESLELDVIFSPKKPMNYEFKLMCKSGIDREYKIGCTACAVLAPLQLCQNNIHFMPTAIGNTSTAIISITNSKLDRLNSAVIRGFAPSQGPRAFHFILPNDCPILISPQVGVVNVGKCQMIQIQFSPKLSKETIAEEAHRLANLRESEEAQGTRDTGEQNLDKKIKRQSLGKPSIVNSSRESVAATSSKYQLVQSTCPPFGSEMWLKAYYSLLSSYQNNCLQYNIPCFVSDTVTTDDQTLISYQPENTLYLEVTAPVIRPSLVLTDGQSSTVDFGYVGTGDVALKKVKIKNISLYKLKLKTSVVLDPCGPFQLRNALHDLLPGSSHELILQFSPHSGGKVYDSLCLSSGQSKLLELRLVGQGVKPQVTLSLGSGDNLRLDIGHVMAHDLVHKTFTLTNASSLKIRFKLNMESLSSKKESMKTFRAANHNGQPPFTCLPHEGVLEAEETTEIKVSFSPDHQSQSYSDRIFASYNGQYAWSVAVFGQAWTNNMYCSIDGEPSIEQNLLLDNAESMLPLAQDGEVDLPPPTQPLLVMFNHSSSVESDKGKSKHELVIGCIRSNTVKKAMGEFTIDSLDSSNPFSKCFTIDPQKGSVDAGGSKFVKITFSPSKDMSNSIVMADTTLTLKGNIVQTYRLLLRALITE